MSAVQAAVKEQYALSRIGGHANLVETVIEQAERLDVVESAIDDHETRILAIEAAQ